MVYGECKEKYYSDDDIVFSKEIKYMVNDEERIIKILEIDENKG